MAWVTAAVGVVIGSFGVDAGAEPEEPAPEGIEAPDLEAEETERLVDDLLRTLPEAERKVPLQWRPDRPHDLTSIFVGNVTWEVESGARRAELLCDRLYIVLPGILAGDRGAPPAEAEGAGEDGGEPVPVENGDAPPGDAGPPPDGAPGRLLFYAYAGGNIRLLLPRQETVIEAEWMYLERREGGAELAYLEGARLLTTVAGLEEVAGWEETRDVRGTGGRRVARGLEALPLVVSARSLRTTDFRRFEASEIVASTCDYEVPHFGLAAPWAAAERVGGEGERSGFTVDFTDARFELQGRRVLPLPLTHWDTRWHDYLPIRNVALGQSSKFGFFAGVDWNLNFFLDQLPLEEAPPVERFLDDSRLDFETIYFSKRGFGWGPKGAYGTDARAWDPWQLQLDRWTYYGEGRYFGIRDRGEDRSSAIEFSDPDRSWANVLHRQSIPHLGIVDVEYSEFSDENFLREYFEAIAKEEKEQESLVSWRRNLDDNVALTGLYKFRTNEFSSEVERLPEGKFRLLQEPILRTGLYSDLAVQGANLRIRPADSLALPSRRFGRFDLANEWAYPLSFYPYLQARPFFRLRYTGYEELSDPARGSEDRGAFGAGVTVSQEWSRVFDTKDGPFDRWFGIERLKHVVIPKVTYFNLFANDLPPEETFGLDEVDTVDLEESVAVSLRQALLSRRDLPGARQVEPLLGPPDLLLETAESTTRSVLDSEVSFVLFPREDRDNDGDPLSLMVFDNTLYPGRVFSLRAWFAADVNDGFRFDTTDLSASVDWIPGTLSTTLGNRFTRRPGLPEGDSNFIYAFASARLGEKWRVQGYWAQDIDEGRNSEITFALARVLHRFAVVFEYSIDPGEDYNQTLSVNFGPLGILSGLRREPLE